MASFDPLHPAQSAILEILSRKKDLTVAELHTVITSESGITVSLPNLYRTIGQMIDVQMLVRSKGRISLNLGWIPHLRRFTESVEKTYMQNTEDMLDFPLKEGERREYSADSLMTLDPIWNHVLLKLAATPQQLPWYIFNSHPWYSLGMRDTETRFRESIVAHGIECNMLYNNDTFLDQYGDKLIRIEDFQTAADTNAPFPKEGYSLWVCGEYVLDCIFPDAISRHFAFFFDTVKTVEQFDAELFTDIFHMKSKSKIVIRKNATEAERLRRIFRTSFAQ